MATLREIVDKAVELKAAAEALSVLQQDRATAAARVTALDTQIAPQLAIVQQLRADLKAML